MAIVKLSIHNLHIDNALGAPPPENIRKEEPLDPHQPDLTCTPNPSIRMVQWQVVAVEDAGGKACGTSAK